MPFVHARSVLKARVITEQRCDHSTHRRGDFGVRKIPILYLQTLAYPKALHQFGPPLDHSFVLLLPFLLFCCQGSLLVGLNNVEQGAVPLEVWTNGSQSFFILFSDYDPLDDGIGPSLSKFEPNLTP